MAEDPQSPPRPVSIKQMIDLPPEDAIAFLAQKGYRTTVDWPEMMHEDHSRAFTVAKVARIDILEAIRTSLDQAMREGVPFEQWKANLVPELVRLGWWGQVTNEDITGVARAVNVTPRRLRTIYDTNLRTARASALWQRVQASKELLPYLRYSAVLDGRTRPLHRAWHGTILPVDHPWWQTHFPPNGWNCRCTVIQLSEAMMESRGWKVTDPPPALDDLVPFYRKATRQTMMVPRGIDPGFGYNPGEDYFHALKPPPLTGPIQRPMPNARGEDGPLTPLPPPRVVPEAALLPPNTTHDEAVAAFIEAFDEQVDVVRGAKVFTDKLGEPLVVSDDFFTWPDGTSKLDSSRRREVVNLLAYTIQDPDEIWWVWENVDAMGTRRWRLTRRYIARFEINGRLRTFVGVVEAGKDGWQGVSAFGATSRSYADRANVRGGVLAYRRE